MQIFNELFYDDDLKKDFNKTMDNDFLKLFPEVNSMYDINYVTARSVIKGKYHDVLLDMLDIVENGELIKSTYRDYHASAWVRLQHQECGGSFVKLMNQFKKAIKAFDKGTSWNIVFYTQILELGMN